MNQQSSNPYFTDLFEHTSDLIHFLAKDGSIEKVNRTWLKTLGYEEEEVIGRSIYEFIWPEEKQLYYEYRQGVIENKTLEDIQFSFLSKAGEKVVVEGHLRPFFDGRKLIHTRGVFHDITRKKEQEQHIKGQHLRLTQFFKYAPDAVVVINEKQLITEWNLKAEEIFGYLREEVLNKPLAELIIPVNYREAHNRGIEHFLNTGYGPVLNKTIEVWAIDKKKREFPVSLSISGVKMEDQWYFIAFLDDISERKKNEAELISKEAELHQTRIEDERNKEFLSIASHELKTPLTSVKALSQIALRGIGKHSQEQTGGYLAKINEHSDKIVHLVGDLLDVSRIQAGKLTIRKEKINFKNLITEVISTCNILYPSHQIKASQIEDVLIRLDPIRIEQVLLNLIANAVKYSPGKDLVEIYTNIQDDMIIVSTKDYGKGIDRNRQYKVFEKFYRIDELSKTDTTGLGIGLFISSEIIKQHGGSIWVESDEGEGATFRFTLPF